MAKTAKRTETQATKRNLPRREIDICGRLRKARELLGYSQREFSHRVGITKARLASYEECRAPIPYDIAMRICRRMQISERWLAVGHGYFQPSLKFGTLDYEDHIQAGMLFSAAFDHVLAPDVEKRQEEVLGEGRSFLPDIDAEDRREGFRRILAFLLAGWLNNTPTEHMEELVNILMDVTTQFEIEKKIHSGCLSGDNLEKTRQFLTGCLHAAKDLPR